MIEIGYVAVSASKFYFGRDGGFDQPFGGLATTTRCATFMSGVFISGRWKSEGLSSRTHKVMDETRYFYEERQDKPVCSINAGSIPAEESRWLSWGIGYRMTLGQAIEAIAERKANNPDAVIRLARLEKTTWDEPSDATERDPADASLARSFWDEAIHDAISTFIDLKKENEDLRQSLQFIASEGGKVAETECGDIRCDGAWCADQAQTALDISLQNDQAETRRP